ncbi:hypothetical protein O988_03664, partial [Pseudogymnoascus sp. VKM F-3808]
RAHGAGDDNGREPWYFGDNTVEIFRKFTKIRYRLLPHIIEQATAGAKLGLPLVRALVVEYPNDRNVWNIESQYHFGSDIMVAPVLQPLEDANKQSIYMPEGTWYDFWNKKKFYAYLGQSWIYALLDQR